MIYLASPYSHHDKSVEHLRYLEACRACADYAQKGHVIYSAIVHWHPIAIAHKLPTDAAFWWKINKEMLRIADKLLVLEINGWRESRGVQAEIQYAYDHNIPTLYIINGILR